MSEFSPFKRLTSPFEEPLDEEQTVEANEADTSESEANGIHAEEIENVTGT